MLTKLKECFGCKKPKTIWKNHDGHKWCQECWNSNPNKKQIVKKVPTPINKKSSKQQKLDVAYMVLRNTFLKQFPNCSMAIPGIGCLSKSSDVHHSRGRGEYLLDQSTFVSCCRVCHNWCELHPIEANKLGFTQSRLSKTIN